MADALGKRWVDDEMVPDRLEFELASNAKGMSRKSPAEITVDGRYLYGAPAGKLELEGEVVVSPATERPGFARRSTTCRTPMRTAKRDLR